MKYDITKELREFTYLTNIYKFIESYNLMGHQIGRKVGDMLEIVTMGVIYRNKDLYDRLDTEGKLLGFTKAGHKVEFGFYNNLHNKTELFGAVECKCVGVEVTKKNQNNNLKIVKDYTYSVNFQNRWLENDRICALTYNGMVGSKAHVTASWQNSSKEIFLSSNDAVKVALDEHGDIHVIAPDESMYELVKPLLRSCTKIICSSFNNDEAKFLVFTCLAGPQTPEKAKQASLVAMDIRKEIDGRWGKDDIPEESKQIISILVLTEFSHWEPKSRNVIKTCIDHNLVVPDEIIIQAFILFEKVFGLTNMFNKINKNDFQRDSDVRNCIDKIIDMFDGYILYDIELNSYVDIEFNNGKLLIKSK